MALSGKSLETLIDLVEIKLSCIEVFDREDAREAKILERCRDELMSLRGRDSSGLVIRMQPKRAGAGAQAQAV